MPLQNLLHFIGFLTNSSASWLSDMFYFKVASCFWGKFTKYAPEVLEDSVICCIIMP